MFEFVKMHGLGNDFVVVDLRADSTPEWFENPAAIVALCDRRRGIGADGVLGLFSPSPTAQQQGAVARLRIRNADGSEAEMCGNGLRCVVRYLVAGAARIAIEPGAGILSCVMGEDEQVEIAMGAPHWELVQRLVPVGGAIWPITTVSMGNPHAVVFCDELADPQALRALVEKYGPQLEQHPMFPARTNVEFVHPTNRESYTAVVWERGCGITEACGTGACAAAVAACLTGRAEPGRFLTVHLLGGPLSILVEPDYRQVYMRGPAVMVYRGQIDI